jgi:hypothetical protein
MDEPAGTGTMLDSGTTTHTNGAWEDITAGIQGFSGTAYHFNGTTSRVIVGDDPSLRPLSDTFTVSVAARFTTIPDPNDPNNGDYDLIRKGVGSSKGGYWKLEIIPNSTRTAVRANCQMQGTTSAIKVTSPLSPLNDGNWHVLSCEKTDTTVTLWVDGKLSNSKAVTIGSISNTVALTLGAKPDADGNIGGDWYDGDLDEASYQVGIPPTISDSFSPTSGLVGTSVTIPGTGLTRASAVRFNGASATFNVGSDTSLTAMVPSGATTGPISVTTPGGTATSRMSFTVTSSGGAISQVQTAHGSSTDVKITASFPSPATAGDVLVAALVVADSSNPAFATPSGWTKPFTPVKGAVFWKVSNGTEQTITVNLAAGALPATMRMTVAELAGANTTNPFDESGSGTFGQAVTSATPTTSGPTTQANEWAIAMVAQNGTNGGAAAPPTNGFSLLEGSSRDVSASNLSASGTVSTTISWMTARAGSWIIATFRPA